MGGIDLLPLVAIIISALVALSQLSKEYRERKTLRAKENQAIAASHESQTLLPIRGANEAVIALQGALKVAMQSEDSLRHRIGNLEIDNDKKDARIDDLERALRICQRKLERLENREAE
jgi:hypothetical protein